MKTKPFLFVLLALALFAAGHIALYYGFVNSWIFQIYLVSLLCYWAGLTLLLTGVGKRPLPAVLGGAVFAGLLFGAASVCRAVWDLPVETVALIFGAATLAAALVCLYLLRKKDGAPRVWQSVLALLVCAAISLSPLFVRFAKQAVRDYYIGGKGMAAIPQKTTTTIPPAPPPASCSLTGNR